MLHYPNIDPEMFNIFGFSIKWYGFCHVIAFVLFYCLARFTKPKKITEEHLADLLCYACLGVLFGGKIGYILFYLPEQILIDPFSLVKFWLPGRSFHGGLIGTILGVYLYCRKYKFDFWNIADFIAPIVPLGIACGRIGNFINGELWGRVTNVPWGMVFPEAGLLPRHPSQLYEFLLEGCLLFVILNFIGKIKIFSKFYQIPRNKSAMFLILYAVFRIFVENYREPDFGQAIIFNMTKGQWLSIPMLLIGIILIRFNCQEKPDNLYKN